MSALATLQKQFQDSVHHFTPDIDTEIVGTERVDVATRVAIYSNGYRLRILEALASDYPGLKALASDEAFDTLGRIYINSHPSRFFNLRWYGGKLEVFLREEYSEQPAWGDMAAFEWAMGLAFDAPDAPTVTFEAMAALPPDAWPALTFALHPSVKRLDLVWPVPESWKATNADQPLPLLEQTAEPGHWLLWRRDLAAYFRSIGADEAWAIDAVTAGSNFAEICEGLAQWVGEDRVALHAASLLRNWVLEQMITRIDLAG